MSRARELARLGNTNAISVDTSNNVGLGTTTSIQYKLDVVGDANFVGVLTATSFGGDGSNLTGVAATDNINTNNIKVSGISTLGTATAFGGDGSGLTGVSAAGIGTEFDSTANTLGNLIYKTPRSFHATGVTSAYINSDATSGNMAFTRLDEIRLGVGATLHIGAGTTMIMNVLNLF